MHKQVIALGLAVAIGSLTTSPAAAQDDGPPSGASLFATHCASCHGTVGEGDGPVASALRVTMPNLRTLARRSGGEYPAEDVRAYVDGRTVPAAHGARYMPVWGDVFGWSDERVRDEQAVTARIDALVEHVRTLQYP